MDQTIIERIFTTCPTGKKSELRLSDKHLDAVKALLADRNSGINVLYEENSAVLPAVTSAYLAGKAISSAGKMLLLSSDPQADSLFLADNARFKDVVVADWNQRPFQVIRTEDEVNSRCHLVLDRMPKPTSLLE